MFKRPVSVLLLIYILLIIIADSFLPVVFLRNHYIKHLFEADKFRYRIVDTQKETEKYYSYTAKIISYFDKKNNKWEKTCGKIKVYIAKDIDGRLKQTELHYGDEIISGDKLVPLRNTASPSSFNYVRYMRHKRIYHIVFMRDFDVSASDRGNKIVTNAKKINMFLKKRLQSSNMGSRQKNLATALLLGDKKDMDKSVRQQFNTSGLAHILCVSGLHIMLIINAFSYLIKYVLPKNKTGVYIRNVFVLLFCWTVAFIVGLTPSALRVAVMLSLLTLSKFTSLDNDRINTLFVTAFIFLCCDPWLLFNISFQLSFLAVFGLLTIRPLLDNMMKRTKIADIPLIKKIFSNMITTVSAQSFCFPVIIYNFSDFPVMFLITNLVIVPLMQIILVSLIIFLFVADVPLLGGIFTSLCNAEMSFMMYVASLADKITLHIF